MTTLSRVESATGYSLVEALVGLTLLSVAASFVVPAIRTLSGDAHLRAATQAVAACLHAARSEAAARGRYVGLRFESGAGSWVGVTYLDGDGDGVRSADIADRTDPEIHRRNIAGIDGVVGFGIVAVQRPRDPSSGRLLERLDDPVRFGGSNIASFGPLGTSSPGSVYLRDGDRRQMVVRLYGRTGKLRTLTWDPAEQSWR